MSCLTPQQALDLAMEHHRGGRLAEAEALSRQVLQIEPNNRLHGLAVWECAPCWEPD